jgi:LysM repeat protein
LSYRQIKLVSQLAEYNDLSVTDGLFVGQKLQLKEPKNSRSSAKAEPKALVSHAA